MAISDQVTLPKSKNTRPLRFITCGNVDDGKSTLVGRLLWDTNAVKSDQQRGIEAAPITLSNGATHPDYALLLDGLQAEREQGITIDVAYRYFSTPRRAFIVADTPGHEQYTRNMVTGASTADLAVLLIDAQTGLTEQTRRHALVASLMGIQELILVINKMDLIDYDEVRFRSIERDFAALTHWLGVVSYRAIPTSAVLGHNVVYRGPADGNWYQGPTLLECLEEADSRDMTNGAFRFCVQRVSRPNESFRGFQGTVAKGSVRLGQEVIVLPSQQKAHIAGIKTFDGDRSEAHLGDAITLVLDRKTDVAHGDIIADASDPPQSGSLLDAKIMVFDDHGLAPSKRYWFKSQSRRQRVRVQASTCIDLDTGDWKDEQSLSVNTIANVQLHFEEPAFFDPYAQCQHTGAFILIDPDNFATVGGGMVIRALDANKLLDASARDQRVQLSMPADLAQAILWSNEFEPRRSEINLVSLNTNELPPQTSESLHAR